MAVDLKGRSLLTLRDFTPEEIRYLLDLAHKLKADKKAGKIGHSLDGKNIVLIFDKTSTRTRCSFEVACYDEGGHATFLSNSQMGKKESLEDTARVLGRLYDGIEYRGFEQSVVEQLAEFSGVPVWNGLTDKFHPTQILADLMTIEESVDKPLGKVKLVYAGDARNNMGNSIMIGCAKMGMSFAAFAPLELWPEEELVREAKAIAAETGGSIVFSEDVSVVEGADVLYTDVWVSMGEEALFAERIAKLTPYRVTMDVVRRTGNDNVIFLHCLPSFHDLGTAVGREIYDKFGITEMEVSDEVFRSKYSRAFDEAENRMHTIKAVMAATLGDLSRNG